MAEVLPDVAGLDRPLQAQRLAGVAPRNVFSVVSFVSVMHVLCLVNLRRHATARFLTQPVAPQSPCLFDEPKGRATLGRCSMYHIWPPHGQAQFGASQFANNLCPGRPRGR